MINTRIPMIASNAQKPPAITPANKATIPAQINSITAIIKPQTKARIHQPIGNSKHISEPTNNAINNFFIFPFDFDVYIINIRILFIRRK